MKVGREAMLVPQADAESPRYILYLYIAGSAPRSRRAVINIKNLCQEFLCDTYELKVIDIFQQPELAKSEQIFAVPTLIKKLPKPTRLLIGDMSNKEAILDAICV